MGYATFYRKGRLGPRPFLEWEEYHCPDPVVELKRRYGLGPPLVRGEKHGLGFCWSCKGGVGTACSWNGRGGIGLGPSCSRKGGVG